MEASEKEKDASSLPPPSTSTSTTATIELPVEQERVVATTQRFLAALKHRQKERDLIDTIRAEHQDQQQQQCSSTGIIDPKQNTALLPSPPTSSHNKDTADNRDNNNAKNDDRVYDYQPKVPYPAWDYNWDGRMTSETSCEALSDLATFRKIKTTNNNNNTAVIPPPSTTTKRNEEDGDDNNNGGGGGGSMKESVVATAEAGTVNDVVVRHIILVRHGQYDESSDDDAKRSLTKIGRQQAKLTGQRLASMLMRARNKNRNNNNNMKSTPCTVTKLHTSDMTRAKETAHIIAHYLPMEGDDDGDNGGGGGDDGTIHIKRMAPDPLLNETLPAPMIPIRPDVMLDATVQDTIINANHHKVEEAFQKYFYRQQTTTTTSTAISSNSSSSSSSNSSNNNNIPVVDNMDDDASTKDTNLIDEDVDATKQEKYQKEPNDHEPAKDDNDDDDNDDGKEEKEQSSAPKPNQKHEFEIIVCHGNIIRYMFCRALQLPPECWLRMSIFNCSLTYIMIPANGYATCRFLGDIGHLPYDYNTIKNIKNNDSDDDGNGSGDDNGDDSNDDENKNENDDSDCSDVVTFSGNYGFNWW